MSRVPGPFMRDTAAAVARGSSEPKDAIVHVPQDYHAAVDSIFRLCCRTATDMIWPLWHLRGFMKYRVTAPSDGQSEGSCLMAC
jgi:hypothetical protein